ncbi:TetR/AcrR family transcriptional regulator [Streptomyces sp. NPDC020096]
MPASSPSDVPEVIWARPERAARGPRPGHSRAEIAAASVRVADAEGLDAVSMRRVAAEIGCGTMSLYNYVPRKEDLYELMVDAVSGEYVFPGQPSGDWRADMLAVARQTRAIMLRHPWLTRLMSQRYGLSPNALRYFDYCLWVLEGLEVDSGTKMELVGVINGVVIAWVSNELQMTDRGDTFPYGTEQEQAARTAYLMRELGGGEYPRLAEVLRTAPPATDPDSTFERVMNRLLAGYEAEARRS